MGSGPTRAVQYGWLDLVQKNGSREGVAFDTVVTSMQNAVGLGHVLIVDYLWGLLVLTRPTQQVKAASTFIDQITSVKNAFKGPWDNELEDLPNVVPISE
ncbi:hypothetical protein DYB28_001855, partial [Aphanomyces astaci]